MEILQYPERAMLPIIRDIFIRCVASVTYRKLSAFLEDNCDGCNSLFNEQTLHMIHHNICDVMTWEEQLIKFLPDIFNELTPQEIGEGVKNKMKKGFEQKETLKELLRRECLMNERHTFCVAAYLYMCQQEMYTHMAFQTLIAQAVYRKSSVYNRGKVDKLTEEEVEVFGKRYHRERLLSTIERKEDKL